MFAIMQQSARAVCMMPKSNSILVAHVFVRLNAGDNAKHLYTDERFLALSFPLKLHFLFKSNVFRGMAHRGAKFRYVTRIPRKCDHLFSLTICHNFQNIARSQECQLTIHSGTSTLTKSKVHLNNVRIQ